MESTESEDRRFRGAVANSLKSHHPSITADHLTPATAETPVNHTPELKAIGGKAVGAEGFPLSGEDIAYNVDAAMQSVTGKSVWARRGRAMKGLIIRAGRLAKRKQATSGAKDPQALDIGE